MTISSGLCLAALGALATWAVAPQVEGVDLVPFGRAALWAGAALVAIGAGIHAWRAWQSRSGTATR